MLFLFLCYCCIAMETVLSAVMTFPSDLSIDSIKCQFGLCQDADLFVMVSGIRPVKDPLYLVHAFSGKLLKLLAGLVSGSILCVSFWPFSLSWRGVETSPSPIE